MIKYETPEMNITYFEDLISTGAQPLNTSMYTNAAYNMNTAALDPTGQIKASAARTVKVQTILEFETN